MHYHIIKIQNMQKYTLKVLGLKPSDRKTRLYRIRF